MTAVKTTVAETYQYGMFSWLVPVLTAEKTYFAHAEKQEHMSNFVQHSIVQYKLVQRNHLTVPKSSCFVIFVADHEPPVILLTTISTSWYKHTALWSVTATLSVYPVLIYCKMNFTHSPLVLTDILHASNMKPSTVSSGICSKLTSPCSLGKTLTVILKTWVILRE